MPADHRIHKQWLKEQVKHVDANPKDINPVLQEFADMIKGSPKLRMLAEAMFEEIPHKKCVVSPILSTKLATDQIRNN